MTTASRLQKSYRDIVAAVGVTAIGMYVAGAEAHTILFVAGGVGVIATEAALRLFGWRDGGDSDGPDGAAPSGAAVA